jgi:hypothetical protein
MHECKFPLTTIKQIFTKLRIVNNQNSPRLELWKEGSKDLFDLAMQWSCCKNIQIDTTRCNNVSKQMEQIMSLVLFAEKAGVKDLSAGMVKHLKPLILELRSERSELNSHHIRTAETLPSPHPIQKLFAEAAMRSRYEFRLDPAYRRMNTSFSSSASDEADESHRDEAHRMAYEGDKWIYAKAMKRNPKFAQEVNKLMMSMWESRGLPKTKERVPEGRAMKGKATKGKGRQGDENTRNWVVIDPLDGTEIVL